MLENICKSIYNIGLKSLTNKIKDVKNSNEIKGQLQDFIEKNQEIFKNVTHEEEFDFQRLAEYISNQLPDKIDEYIYGTSDNQRKIAIDTVIAKAIDYAKPDTSEGKKYVKTLIFQCLDLLHNFYVTTYLDPKTKLAIAETSSAIYKEITDDGEKTRNAIADLQNKINSKDDFLFRDRIDIMNAVDSLKLPDYTRESIPKTVYPNNPKILVNELDVLFNNDSIQSNYKLLQNKIKIMEGLIYELKEFHSLCQAPDGEGGLVYLVWDEIIQMEYNLMHSNYSEEIEESLKEFCSQNEITTFIHEISEPVTYNYYTITRKMEQMQQEFEELKVNLVNQMKCYIQGL